MVNNSDKFLYEKMNERKYKCVVEFIIMWIDLYNIVNSLFL